MRQELESQLDRYCLVTGTAKEEKDGRTLLLNPELRMLKVHPQLGCLSRYTLTFDHIWIENSDLSIFKKGSASTCQVIRYQRRNGSLDFGLKKVTTVVTEALLASLVLCTFPGCPMRHQPNIKAINLILDVLKDRAVDLSGLKLGQKIRENSLFYRLLINHYLSISYQHREMRTRKSKKPKVSKGFANSTCVQ